jgi:hypothetical protein
MNAIEALTKIRVMLGMESDAEAKSVELAEATLVDGTVVKVEGELAEGKNLFVVTEEGDIPAPEGIHETADGMLVTVDANGVIAAIEEKPVEAGYKDKEEMSEEDATEAVEGPQANDFSQDDFLAQVAGLIAPLQEKIDQIGAQYDSLKHEFSSFKDEPAAERITNNLTMSTETIKGHGDRQEKRYQTLLELRKNK